MKYTSAIAATGSGSIGGATASRGRGGQYFRRRAIPTNTATSRQQTIRNGVSTLSNLWGQLSSTVRAAWAVYADNVAVTDTLGQTIKLSGFNWFLGSNQIRKSIGVANATNAPTTMTMASLSTVGVTAVASTGIATVTFSTGDIWAGAVGGYLQMLFSRPQSAGISYFTGPYQLGFSVAGAVSPPTSGQTGSLPFATTSASKVFWEARCINADGRYSPVQRGVFFAS